MRRCRSCSLAQRYSDVRAPLTLSLLHGSVFAERDLELALDRASSSRFSSPAKSPESRCLGDSMALRSDAPTRSASAFGAAVHGPGGSTFITLTHSHRLAA